MSSIDLEFLIDTIVKSLVDFPDEIVIETVDGESSRIIEIKTNKADTGKVIGRQGRTADAIRTIVTAASARENKRTIVQIVD